MLYFSDAIITPLSINGHMFLPPVAYFVVFFNVLQFICTKSKNKLHTEALLAVYTIPLCALVAVRGVDRREAEVCEAGDVQQHIGPAGQDEETAEAPGVRGGDPRQHRPHQGRPTGTRRQIRKPQFCIEYFFFFMNYLVF